MKQTSIKFNDQEWETHEWLKSFFGIENTYGGDAATIKMSEEGMKNVLLSLFGDKLSKVFRRKYKIDKAG